MTFEQGTLPRLIQVALAEVGTAETGNTSAVLNGEIDDFIEAGIRWRRSS